MGRNYNLQKYVVTVILPTAQPMLKKTKQKSAHSAMPKTFRFCWYDNNVRIGLEDWDEDDFYPHTLWCISLISPLDNIQGILEIYYEEGWSRDDKW